MSLFHFTWKSMLHRKWTLLFTFLSILLSFALVMTVRETALGIIEGLKRESSTYEMVVGAKGSATQLVLSSLMRIDRPLGNIPYSLYEEIRRDDRILSAVPIALGDSYLGVPIIGTTKTYFAPFRIGMAERFHLKEGTWFQRTGDVVAGSEAAKALVLTVGDRFYGNHGLQEEASESHRQLQYRVVGILESTGGSDDRGLFTPIESIWLVHGKKEAYAREVTAILIKPIQLGVLPKMKEDLEARDNVQASYTTPVFRQLLGWVERIGALLTFISYVTLWFALLFLFFMLLTVAIQRKGEFMHLRALGIGKRLILLHLLLESLLLIGGGIAGGWALSLLLSSLLSRYALHAFGLPLPFLIIDGQQILFSVSILILSLILSILPYVWLFRKKGLERDVPGYEQ